MVTKIKMKVFRLLYAKKIKIKRAEIGKLWFIYIDKYPMDLGVYVCTDVPSS